MPGSDGAFSIAKLKTEIETTNPSDYAGLADRAVADKLNAIPSTVTGAPFTVNDDTVDSATARATIPHTELAALGAAEQDGLRFYTAHDRTPNTQAVRTFIGSLSLSAPTVAALIALTEREGSRAESLWGAGLRVSHEQVAEARALP